MRFDRYGLSGGAQRTALLGGMSFPASVVELATKRLEHKENNFLAKIENRAKLYFVGRSVPRRRGGLER